MKTKILSLIACMALLGVSQAGATTYNVNETVNGGSVTGTIQTDGDTGVLGQSDITGWNLLLNDGTNTFDLLGPGIGNNSAVALQGTDLSATATQLLYNFDGSGLILFQNPDIGSSENFLCFESLSSGCGDASAIVIGELDGDGVLQVQAESGTQVIASSGLTTTPLPAALPLFGAGLSVMGLLGWRRKRKTAAATVAA